MLLFCGLKMEIGDATRLQKRMTSRANALMRQLCPLPLPVPVDSASPVIWRPPLSRECRFRVSPDTRHCRRRRPILCPSVKSALDRIFLVHLDDDPIDRLHRAFLSHFLLLSFPTLVLRAPFAMEHHYIHNLEYVYCRPHSLLICRRAVGNISLYAVFMNDGCTVL
jgi:hypothetical protein